MCGLVGVIAKRSNGFWTKEANLFEQLLYADALRGFDATGVFGINKEGNIDIKKQAVPASEFIKNYKYEEFKKKIVSDYHIVIGHNRHATKGDKTDSNNAHPFWDKDDKICLVHNGTIHNQKEFCTEATVDSEAIANALATKPIEEVIENIDGAFALIWYNVDERAIYMIRNNQRPLTIGENNDTFAIASEWQMTNWISTRNDIKYETIHILSENTLYRISLEDKKLETLQKIEKKKSPTQQTTTTGIILLPGNRTRSGVPTNSDFNGVCPPQFFWDNTVIQKPQDVMTLLSRRDLIQVMVDGYVERDAKNVLLECSMLNITHPWLNVKMYVSPQMFKDMNLTKAYRTRILNMTMEGDKVILYVSGAVEQDVVETKNNVWITDDMWMDTTFPSFCDVCNQGIRWSDLENCEVLLHDMNVETIICQRCT